MADELAEWWIHAVQVKTRTGSNGYGNDFAEAESINCYLEDDTKIVTDSRGNEVVSSGRLFAALTLEPKFTPDSEVIISPTRTARVISVGRNDSGSLGNLDHLEILLT